MRPQQCVDCIVGTKLIPLLRYSETEGGLWQSLRRVISVLALGIQKSSADRRFDFAVGECNVMRHPSTLTPLLRDSEIHFSLDAELNRSQCVPELSSLT